MSEKDKKNLLDKLTEVHLATRTTLEKVELKMTVHKDSGWSVRDILGHIATWNLEVALQIRSSPGAKKCVESASTQN